MAKQMSISRLVMGIILIIVGLLIVFEAWLQFLKLISNWFALIYGMPVLIIGILLLIDFGKEDIIEKIKKRKK